MSEGNAYTNVIYTCKKNAKCCFSIFITDVTGEMNFFVSFERLNHNSESYFKRHVIQDWIRDISSQKFQKKN